MRNSTSGQIVYFTSGSANPFKENLGERRFFVVKVDGKEHSVLSKSTGEAMDRAFSRFPNHRSITAGPKR
jgi:hypothetical protein